MDLSSKMKAASMMDDAEQANRVETTATAGTPETFLESLALEHKTAVEKLRQVILDHLPEGFEEILSDGMLHYVVPHRLYPAGYHVNPKAPLPFISLASQKKHIALYHMGLYAMPELLDWFEKAYAEQVSGKLDMGKSCIRFKKPDHIPYALIASLCEKITVRDYVAAYEKTRSGSQK